MTNRCHLFAVCFALLACAQPPDSAEANAPQPARGSSRGGSEQIASVDFSPRPNGFSFENFGNEVAGESLTVDEARAMFGDEVVCESVDADGCNPSPAAQRWVRRINRMMGGGHCEGMAVLSLRLWKALDRPVEFDPSAATTWDLSLTADLRHRIARYWAYQMTDPTSAYASNVKENQKPSEVLDALIASLKAADDPLTLGFYNDKGEGHAVTPYAVVDLGGGHFQVVIYDNNYPGKEQRVDFDRNAETWRYDAAATNPGETAEPWAGDASTHTLDLAPLSLRSRPAECPFCASTAREVAFTGRGALLVTDASGRRTGRVAGAVVNEIAGARVLAPKVRGLVQEPVLIIPAQAGFEIAVDGNSGTDAAADSLSVFGLDSVIELENIQVAPGETERLLVSASGALRYQPAGREAPAISVALRDPGTQYEVRVTGIDATSGQEIDVEVDRAAGRLMVTDNDGAAEAYEIDVDRVAPGSRAHFVHAQTALGPTAREWIDFGSWSGTGPLTLEIDDDGDGVVDRTEALANALQ